MGEVPIVERTGNVLRFQWPSLNIAATLRRLRSEGAYTKGEITWISTAPGGGGHLHQGVLTLNSSNSKAQLARILGERFDLDWSVLIEQLAVEALKFHRQGEPAVPIRTQGEEAKPIEPAIEPLSFREQPCVIFGEPGTAKSYLALLMALQAAAQKVIPGIPLRPHGDFKVLYLDWESCLQDQAVRLSRLERGLGVEADGKIHYRYCAAPLSHDIEQIQELVLDTGANFLVIDSLGLAAGDDLKGNEAPQEFFRALRTLRCTSLIIGHCTKNAEPWKRTIYGSQFFTALARSIAEVRTSQEANGNELYVAIYHRKNNIGRLYRPFALRFVFEGNHGPVKVLPQDIGELPDLAEGLSVPERILNLLTHSSKPMFPKEVADQLGIAGNTARQTLRRMLRKGQVVQLEDGRYAARAPEEEVPF